MLWGGGVDIASIVRCEPMELPMQTLNNLSRSFIALEPASTLIAVIEMSLSSWLVAGIVPGIERQPLKKLAVDESALLRLLHRWREEAEKAGCRIERIVVAFEAGRDGFWLARWLKARSIEAHVIHAASVAVSREHRRAKTDRLDAELLKRAFLGWLRGERNHCKVVAIPTLKDEDAKRPSRERESLVGEQSRIVNRMKAALIRLGIRGFNPKLTRAAGRLDSLRTPEGEPIPPNTLAELRRGMVQLAWRFLTYQKESALAQWYRARTENARGARKPMIVALARKLLIALWRFVWQGVVPDGVVLRPAQ